MVTGQGLGLPGVDQVYHVQGQVALGLAVYRLPPVLMFTLKLAHPPAVPEPGVIVHTPDPDQPPSLLHKVMSVEKLKGEDQPVREPTSVLFKSYLCISIVDPRKIICSYTRRR